MNNSKIKFTYKDVPYVLEYNRDAIKRMESVGFSLEDFAKKPMFNLDIAFKALFLKNHRKTNEQIIEDIYDQFKDKEKLIQNITIMLNEAYDTLLDNNDNEGNIDWEIVK